MGVGRTRRLHPEERPRLAAELAAAYTEGATITDLMATGPYDYGTVLALLEEAGATLRSRGRQQPHRGDWT